MGSFDVMSWNAIYVKAGTPADIAGKLNSALREALADATLQARLLELGIVADPTTPDEMAALFKADVARWTAVIDANKIEKQ